MSLSSPAGGQFAEGDSGTGTASPPDGLAAAEAIRDAVLSRPDIAGLSAGAFGEISSYFAGRQVPGLRIGGETVEVHVVAVYGRPLRDIADDLGHTLGPLLAGRRLQVVVSDVLLPGETLDGQDDSDDGNRGRDAAPAGRQSG